MARRDVSTRGVGHVGQVALALVVFLCYAVALFSVNWMTSVQNAYTRADGIHHTVQMGLSRVVVTKRTDARLLSETLYTWDEATNVLSEAPEFGAAGVPAHALLVLGNLLVVGVLLLRTSKSVLQRDVLERLDLLSLAALAASGAFVLAGALVWYALTPDTSNIALDSATVLTIRLGSAFFISVAAALTALVVACVTLEERVGLLALLGLPHAPRDRDGAQLVIPMNRLTDAL